MNLEYNMNYSYTDFKISMEVILSKTYKYGKIKGI